MELTAAELIALEARYGASIYSTLPVVLASANGAMITDVDDVDYIDMYSAYSANVSHGDPRIAAAMMAQIGTGLVLTARCVHHNRLGPWMKRICELTGFHSCIPKNGGVEAVEVAFKAMMRYGVRQLGIPNGEQQIIVMKGSFSGRTLAALAAMHNVKYAKDFGPMSPAFIEVPFGDMEAMRAAINENTVGVFMEPWLGEGGVVPAPPCYLAHVCSLMHEHGKIVVFDEIQTGFGRTGQMFAWQHDGLNAKPDGMTLGKALSGGGYCMSALVGSEELMSVFDPGSDGSTYGGNPLACAASEAAMDMIVQDNLVEHSAIEGQFAIDMLHDELDRLPHIRNVRGGGLFIGIELDRPVAPSCLRLLQERHVICLDTHQNVLRVAPPLVIQREQLTEGLRHIVEVLRGA